MISEKKIGSGYEEKKYCWFCALTNLYELEESDYQFENKKAVIKEIRLALHSLSPQESSELLECYG